MKTVTSAEFQRYFGRYQDEALIQPISITRNDREHVVMISAEEYLRLKKSVRQTIHVEELSEQDLVSIEQAGMPSGDEALDNELTN